MRRLKQDFSSPKNIQGEGQAFLQIMSQSLYIALRGIGALRTVEPYHFDWLLGDIAVYS
jgi:hypothetical protein